MITLFTFGPAFGLPDASPFVIKATVLLKMAKQPYRTDKSGYRRAPKGKLPYIDDDGLIVADSTLIRWHLEKKYKLDFDLGLSEQERAISWAVEKLLEDNLYWPSVDARWMHDDNFYRGPAMIFKRIPQPMRFFIQRIVRNKIRKSLLAQGTGRHSQADMHTIARKGIASVAAILGDKPYLMGDKICAADAALFGFIASALCPLFESPIRTAAESHPNLVAYVERMRLEFFPEMAAITP